MTAVPPWYLRWRGVRVQGRPAEYGESDAAAARLATPVVFLHGWGLASRSYKRALGRISRLGYHVVAPTLPGFGGTAALPPSAASFPGYADWLAAFLDAVGLRGPVVLVGHSFGGGVAIQTAHDHGDRVAMLVLANSVGGSVWKQGRGRDPQLAERPLWDWGIHLPLDLRSELAQVVPVVAADVARNVVRNLPALWRVGRIARSADLRPELEALRSRGLPIVVLWGSEDRILPAASLEALALASGQEPTRVKGTHSWMISQPARFAQLITNVAGLAEALGEGSGEPVVVEELDGGAGDAVDEELDRPTPEG